MKIQQELKLYEMLHLIRHSQEALIKNYHPEDKMRCPIHFCLGQEALAACLSFFLKKEDFVLSHHRSHGYYLSKKCPVDKMVSEFYGKEFGSNAGLAGSQELSLSENNFFSGTILSGMFSIALGTAFAQKNYQKKNITVTIIGDGGMEEGICYETLNLASLKSLPILFICENNNYSVHTNIGKRTLTNNFKKKVESFDINYQKISDHNPENIYKKIEKVVKEIRKNQKPIFIEFDTMRTCSHVGPENDDNEFNYRKKDLAKWKGKDSVEWMRKKLLKSNQVKKVMMIEKNNQNLLNKSIKKAKVGNFLNYEKSLKLNFIESYSKLIKKFSEPKKDFTYKQKVTKMNPY